jgi:hypothetical protein
MYVHHEKKLAFVAHPRTASSATAHTLMGMGFEIDQHGHHGVVDMPDEDWTTFCTVRNPFDVLVSWYYAQKREHTFDDWLPIFMRDCHHFQGVRMFFGRFICTHVLHYETLQRDFDWFCYDSGLPITTILKRNVSPLRMHGGYMSKYNFERARMVVERFQKDFTENAYPLPLLKDC